MPPQREGENDDALNADLSRSTLFDVTGRVALVTGGGSGIGAMIAAGLVQNGADVYIASRKGPTAYAAQLAEKGPGKCTALVADLTKPDDIEMLKEKFESLGRLDILINNSGTSWDAKLEEYPMKGFNKVFNLNVGSVFALSKALMPLLEKSGRQGAPSNIVNIASCWGLKPPPSDIFAYSTSKAAVVMMSKHLSIRTGPTVTVNALCPGPFPSRMMRPAIEATGNIMAKNCSTKRVGEPKDIAGSVLFLCSPAGSFCDGMELLIDGGLVNYPKGGMTEE